MVKERPTLVVSERASHLSGVVKESPALVVSEFLFGIIYLFAGLRLESAESNLLIALGAIGKLTFFIILLAYALNDVSPWGLVGLAAVDLLYALLFTECLWFKTTQRRKQVVVS